MKGVLLRRLWRLWFEGPRATGTGEAHPMTLPVLSAAAPDLRRPHRRGSFNRAPRRKSFRTIAGAVA